VEAAITTIMIVNKHSNILTIAWPKKVVLWWLTIAPLSVMKFQAQNLPDRIFCGTYAEASNLWHAVP
jgi:hypothetical protein